MCQIYSLLCLLAGADDTLDRRELRDFLGGDVVRKGDAYWLRVECSAALIHLDGMDRFLACVRLFHSALLKNFEEETGWAFRSWIDELSGHAGNVDAALAKTRMTSPELDRLMSLNAANDQRIETQAATYKNGDGVVDYASAKAALGTKVSFSTFWIDIASSEDLALAANDRLAESEPKRIRAYLRIFQKRDYPLPPEALFRFVEDASLRMHWLAVKALSRLSDPKVKRYALAFFEKDVKISSGIVMLGGVYQTGDFTLIEAAMRGRQFDEDEWHNIGSSVLHLLEKAEVPAQASRDMLLRLY
jgi:hypothetical protein